jgi:NAD(P)H-flavin reductase
MRLKLNINTIEQIEDYLVLTFDKPSDFVFEIGQYGVFMHVNKEFDDKKMRAFSFASNSVDEKLMIVTKAQMAASPFKEIMKQLKPGDQMVVNGPMGRFTPFDNKKPTIYICGDAGVAPIRPHLLGEKHIDSKLIYFETNENYLFLPEFENVENLTIELSSSRSRTIYLTELIAKMYRNRAYYFVSGPPLFVVDVIGQLETLGVFSDQIIVERLTGY